MRNSVILTAQEDQDMGGLGLLMGDMRQEGLNPCQTGLLVAHDLLEHQNGPKVIGTIDDELEALGGIWYVRGQYDDLNRDTHSRYTVHQNIGFDITRMFRDFFYGSHVDTNPPRTKACDADDDFLEIIQHATKNYNLEFDDEEDIEARFKEYSRVCLPRMRIGYRKAVKRFKGVDANSLFWAIAKAVDPYVKHLEYEGQQFKLSYRTEGNRIWAFCEEHYDD